MSPDTFIIGSASQVGRFVLFLKSLTFERPWKVTIERVEPYRTVEQNAVLRGFVRQIAEFTGEEPDRMHEILLARRFGSERVELGGGNFINRPARRSSDLSRREMADYMTWVQAFAAEHLGMELA